MFLNAWRNRLKLIYSDRHVLVIWMKRLEKNRFERPLRSIIAKQVIIEPAELQASLPPPGWSGQVFIDLQTSCDGGL